MPTRRASQKTSLAATVPADVLCVVAETHVEVAVKMAAVCTHWREAVQGGRGDATDAMSALVVLGKDARKDACMKDVMAALALSSDKVKLGAYRQKRNRYGGCLLYTSPSPRDRTRSRMPSSA